MPFRGEGAYGLCVCVCLERNSAGPGPDHRQGRDPQRGGIVDPVYTVHRPQRRDAQAKRRLARSGYVALHCAVGTTTPPTPSEPASLSSTTNDSPREEVLDLLRRRCLRAPLLLGHYRISPRETEHPAGQRRPAPTHIRVGLDFLSRQEPGSHIRTGWYAHRAQYRYRLSYLVLLAV